MSYIVYISRAAIPYAAVTCDRPFGTDQLAGYRAAGMGVTRGSLAGKQADSRTVGQSDRQTGSLERCLGKCFA